MNDSDCGSDNASGSEPESTQTQNPTQGKGVQPSQFKGAARASSIEHNAVVKNIGNTTSFRLAVSAMCFHCLGCTKDHYEMGVKSDIKDCTATECPLWHFRPYK